MYVCGCVCVCESAVTVSAHTVSVRRVCFSASFKKGRAAFAYTMLKDQRSLAPTPN